MYNYQHIFSSRGLYYLSRYDCLSTILSIYLDMIRYLLSIYLDKIVYILSIYLDKIRYLLSILSIYLRFVDDRLVEAESESPLSLLLSLEQVMSFSLSLFLCLRILLLYHTSSLFYLCRKIFWVSLASDFRLEIKEYKDTTFFIK